MEKTSIKTLHTVIILFTCYSQKNKTILVENISVLDRGYEEGLKQDSSRRLQVDITVLFPDCGDGDMDLHMC